MHQGLPPNLVSPGFVRFLYVSPVCCFDLVLIFFVVFKDTPLTLSPARCLFCSSFREWLFFFPNLFSFFPPKEWTAGPFLSNVIPFCPCFVRHSRTPDSQPFFFLRYGFCIVRRPFDPLGEPPPPRVFSRNPMFFLTVCSLVWVFSWRKVYDESCWDTV